MILQGKTAVVTGAGQGIGRAIAQAFAAEGARVVVNDIRGEAAEKATGEIVGAGGAAIADTSDISTMAGAEAAVDRCISEFGSIGILVNNAGILRDRMSFNMTETEWDQVIAVCLKGPFACSHFASRWMRKNGGGRIINITSRSGLRGSVGQANYAAAKAGVMGLTRTLSLELSRNGITVNAICPRAATAMTDSIPDDVKTAKDASWSGSSVRRRGDPEDVAPLAVYLACDDAGDITGQAVGIGGDKLSMWCHPHEVAEAFMLGGWSVQQLREAFRSSVGYELQSLGNKD